MISYYYKYFLIFISILVIIIGQTETAIKDAKDQSDDELLQEETVSSRVIKDDSSGEDEFQDASDKSSEQTSKINRALDVDIVFRNNYDDVLEKETYIGTLGKNEKIKGSIFDNPEVEHFLDFNIHNFDTLNRECYLAFIVYVCESLYASKDDDKKTKNIKALVEYYLKLLRILKTDQFDEENRHEIWKFYEDIHNWLPNQTDDEDIDSQACLMKSFFKFSWTSPKAQEILNTVSKNTFTVAKKAYKLCEKNLNAIAEISSSYEKELISHQLKNIGKIGRPKLKGFEYLPGISNKFGSLLLLLTQEEFDLLRTKEFDGNEEYQMEYLMYDIMRPALEDIFRGIIHILKDIEISPYDIAEPNDFRGKTRVNVELLVLLKHLHQKVIDVTKEMHSLYLLKHERRVSYQVIHRPYKDDFMTLYYNYDAYKHLFQHQWARLFQSVSHVFEVDQFFNKLFQVSGDAKLSYENLKQPIVSPTMSFEKTMFYHGILIKGRRVQPSVIGYTAASNSSWNDHVHHETNTHQWKVMLLEFNVWLSILNYNCRLFNQTLSSIESLSRNYSNKENTYKLSYLSPLIYTNHQKEAFVTDKLFLEDSKELTPTKTVDPKLLKNFTLYDDMEI